MTLQPTSNHYYDHDIFEPDITKLLGWEEAEVATKLRIIKTAKDYLDAGEPETQTWIRTNNFSHPPFAGYQALYLLSKQEPDFISTISFDLWVKWIPVLLKSLNLPHDSRSRKDETCREIVKTAYQTAPEQFIETLIALMLQHNCQPCTAYPNDVYLLTSDLLDQCITIPILSRVQDEDLNAGMLKILLTDFFKYESDKALAFALSFVDTPIPESGEARAKAIVAARLLATHANNSSWSVLWSAIQQDHQFGREVLEHIAFQAVPYGRIEKQIKEEYIADLYIFLAQQYPEIEESEQEAKELRGVEAHIMGITDEIRMWKNYIPQRLQERGTPEACAALQKIIHELPEEKEQLQQRVLETEILARRKTWKPPRPEDILQLTAIQEPSNSNLSLTLDEINQGIKQMANTPNQDFSGATFNSFVNFGPNHGTQIEKQNNYASDPQTRQALNQISELLQDIQKQHPQASQLEVIDIAGKELETMHQNNPQKWRTYRDFLSIVFAGGVESVKLVCPYLGIPIEIAKRLYEISERNRQLPSS